MRHLPWIAILLIGAALNWLWWDDGYLRPAVTVHHTLTVTQDVGGNITSKFCAGDMVIVQGETTVHRACPRRYVRSLQFPDGERRSLRESRGVYFEDGEHGTVQVPVQTQRNWPTGQYLYSTVGYHDCNAPFNQQRIVGFHSTFTLMQCDTN